MLENIKNKIASWILKKHIRSKPSSEINFNNFFTEARTVLIILPHSDEELKYCEKALQFLQQKGKDITLFVAEHRVSLMGNLKNIKHLTYGISDQNRLNLPAPQLKSSLKDHFYDIVIDFNSNPGRFFKAVTVYCNSKVSVGYKGIDSDAYYNFQIPQEINTKNSYENLLNSLNMF